MKSLKKRVGDLERATGRGEDSVALLAVDYAIDGGLVYKGKWYEDNGALIRALGMTERTVSFMHFPAEDTAVELLAAEARARHGKRTAVQESGTDPSAEVADGQIQSKNNEAHPANVYDCRPQNSGINPFMPRPYDPDIAPRQLYADRPDTLFGGENALFKGYEDFPFQRR